MYKAKVDELLKPLGLKPLDKSWAKTEIFLGLAFVYLGLLIGPSWTEGPGMLFLGMMSFVLGGYLAMAGHRSHLYQSTNLLTAFTIEEIRKAREGTAT